MSRKISESLLYHWSPTKIETAACPLAFYLHYILRVPHTISYAMALGRVCHEGVDVYNKRNFKDAKSFASYAWHLAIRAIACPYCGKLDRRPAEAHGLSDWSIMRTVCKNFDTNEPCKERGRVKERGWIKFELVKISHSDYLRFAAIDWGILRPGIDLEEIIMPSEDMEIAADQRPKMFCIEAINLARNFYKVNQGWPKAVYSERSFRFRCGKIIFNGKFDEIRAFDPEINRAIIRDIKSSRKRLSQKLLDLDLQFTIYGVALGVMVCQDLAVRTDCGIPDEIALKLGGNPDYVNEYIQLEHYNLRDNVITETVRNNAHFWQVIELVQSKIGMIFRQEFPPLLAEDLCSGCLVRSYCLEMLSTGRVPDSTLPLPLELMPYTVSKHPPQLKLAFPRKARKKKLSPDN